MVRKEKPNGTKLFFEGGLGSERSVREEIGTKKKLYKGAKGLEMLVCIEKTEYYDGNAGCETLVGSLCCVCLNAEKDVLFAPCGHLCMCQLCHAKLPAAIENACPLCKCPGTGIRVYF